MYLYWVRIKVVPNIGTMIKSTSSRKYQDLIAWLKEERERRGLSMRQLAQRLDEPHSFVGKIEQGERRLDVYEYYQYCKALGIEPQNGFRLFG